MTDCTGKEIRVGDTIVHACSRRWSRGVKMRIGVVTKLRAVRQSDRFGEWNRETVFYGKGMYARDPKRVVVTITKEANQ